MQMQICFGGDQGVFVQGRADKLQFETKDLYKVVGRWSVVLRLGLEKECILVKTSTKMVHLHDAVVR